MSGSADNPWADMPLERFLEEVRRAMTEGDGIFVGHVERFLAEVERLRAEWSAVEKARQNVALDLIEMQKERDEARARADQFEQQRNEAQAVAKDMPSLSRALAQAIGQRKAAEQANAALRAGIGTLAAFLRGLGMKGALNMVEIVAEPLLAEHAPAEGTTGVAPGGSTKDDRRGDPGNHGAPHPAQGTQGTDRAPTPTEHAPAEHAPAEGVCSLCGNTGEVDPGGTVHDQPAPLLPCPYCKPAEGYLKAQEETELMFPETLREACIRAHDTDTTLDEARDYFQRLACLGNGEFPGNSDGNRIALAALDHLFGVVWHEGDWAQGTPAEGEGGGGASGTPVSWWGRR